MGRQSRQAKRIANGYADAMGGRKKLGGSAFLGLLFVLALAIIMFGYLLTWLLP